MKPMRQPKRSIRRSSPGTFYFFPAFLPLVEVVPWLLALIGAAAGLAGFSMKDFWRAHKCGVLAIAGLCAASGAGIAAYNMPAKEVAMEGTRLIAPADFMKPVFHPQIPQDRGPQPDLATFDKLWSRRVDEQILSAPVISGDLLIYGTFKGKIEAIWADGGRSYWTLEQNAPVFSLTLGEDGVLYAGEGLHETQAASLSAIDPLTGEIKWRREFLGHLEENIRLDAKNNRLWVSAGPGGVWALDSRDATVLWHQEIGHADTQPLLDNNVLYVPAQPDEKKHDAVLFALDAGSGKILWKLEQPGQPWGSPLVDKTGQMILTTTGEGQIGVTRESDKGWAQAVSPQGKLLWQTDLPDMALQPGIYLPEAGIIVHTLKNGEVVALNVKDGSVAWRAPSEGQFQSAAILIEGNDVPMVASMTFDGVLNIRNGLNGDLLVRRAGAGSKSTSSPGVKGDAIYALSAYEITAYGGVKTLRGMAP